MPILKQLVQNGPPQGKRRLRAELTREMISAPLGDFRHTMHVGRGGEAFGDTSFLSRTGGGEGEEREKAVGGVEEGEERGKAEEGAEEREKVWGGAEEREEAGGAEESDGLRAVPQQQEAVEGGRGEREGRAPQGVASSPPWPIRPAESVLSLFQVDLGPSMLSEVLGVMEQEPRPSLSPHTQPSEPAIEWEGRDSVPGEDNEEEEGEEDQEEEDGGFTFDDEEEQEDEEIRV